jgi:hypothetical protein
VPLPTRPFAVALAFTLFAASGLAAQDRPGTWRSFSIELAAAATGSALGYGTVAAFVDACSRDGDLVSCTDGPRTAPLATATALSVLTTRVVGQRLHTSPSTGGAIVGSLLGAVAAVGVEHLLREQGSVRMNEAGVTVTVAVTQGLLTAVGSRIGDALHRR